MSKQKPVEKKIEKNVPGSKKEYPIRFYIFSAIFPLLILALLELGLRVASFGSTEIPQWIEVGGDYPNKIVLNPDIAHRWFQSKGGAIPYSIFDAFDKVKAPNSFRVFVLGESSAAGFPFEPTGSFSRYIRDRLQLDYPDKKIEVINVSMAAISSYAIKDMIKGVIEQKPDLILIYTGHNEYYGALGVGSNEALSSKSGFGKLIKGLTELRIVKLIKSIIPSKENGVAEGAKSNAGLMERLAKEQEIVLASDTYKAGIAQFTDNMTEILTVISDAKVPAIISRIASNLKDQAPFRDAPQGKKSSEIYKNAKEELAKGDSVTALLHFVEAKDNDCLRFRAPSEINEVIDKLAKSFNIAEIETDKIFNSVSPNGITGNNLMVDHLHPTLAGYQLIGKTFYDEMSKKGFLPAKASINGNSNSDATVRTNFNFTRVDSLIGAYRIFSIKEQWPFKAGGKKEDIIAKIKPENHIDSLALRVVTENLAWDKVHREAAQYFLTIRDSVNYIKEMNAVISQYPYMVGNYEEMALGLMKLEIFNAAYNQLLKGYDIKPSPFSTKWLGIISLSKNNLGNAKKYLLESINYSSADAQVHYNLAGVYINEKNFVMARAELQNCLSLEPRFPGARELLSQFR